MGSGKSSGQASLEYALLLVAFISLLVGMGALWKAAQDGRFTQLATQSASHSLEEGYATIHDIISY